MKPSDDIIVKGFQQFNADITKEYFYGYCRRAYLVLDSKYQLRYKAGLDFYSLAHEYYLQLLSHGFRQLTDRPEHMKLSSFMFRGFWYVTMDALKAHRKEFENITDADAVLQYVRSTDREGGMMEQIAQAVERHYHDRTMSHIAWQLFVVGYKQNEIAQDLGLTPSAVNQRYKKMMEEVVTPFVIENYSRGIQFASMVREDEHFSLSLDAASRDFTDSGMQSFAQRFFSVQKATNIMEKNRITPEFITSLKENEIFVFGSNLHGIHAGGAARMAHAHFGAEMGNGVGIQGQSYAIPTMQGGVETIKPYVDEFLAYASQHKQQHFLVTPIGCGIAGFEPSDIAPLFAAAKSMSNISLPESFWDEL